jgi:hypothetical protein
LEADELMLVFGERNDVVLVLKNQIKTIVELFEYSINIGTSHIDKQITKDVPIKKRATHGARNYFVSACKRTENN